MIEKLNTLHRFAKAYPKSITARLQNNQSKLDAAFIKGRETKHPIPPKTATDPAVCIILESYFNYSPKTLDSLIESHKAAMAAENIVGELLERFLASVLEPHGWIWCSGSVVRAVDFIKEQPANQWLLLQIKNRDNSENSSSQAVREGTNIKKWFRAFSRQEAFNWSAFPLAPDDPIEIRDNLTEENFRSFIRQYLKNMNTY